MRRAMKSPDCGKLVRAGRSREAVLSEFTPLRKLINQGGFGLLHFACHNSFSPAGGSSISLGNRPFTVTNMQTARINRSLLAVHAAHLPQRLPDGWTGRDVQRAGRLGGSLHAGRGGSVRWLAVGGHRRGRPGIRRRSSTTNCGTGSRWARPSPRPAGPRPASPVIPPGSPTPSTVIRAPRARGMTPQSRQLIEEGSCRSSTAACRSTR